MIVIIVTLLTWRNLYAFFTFPFGIEALVGFVVHSKSDIIRTGHSKIPFIQKLYLQSDSFFRSRYVPVIFSMCYSKRYEPLRLTGAEQPKIAAGGAEKT